jgi:hypothetical protein
MYRRSSARHLFGRVVAPTVSNSWRCRVDFQLNVVRVPERNEAASRERSIRDNRSRHAELIETIYPRLFAHVALDGER